MAMLKTNKTIMQYSLMTPQALFQETPLSSGVIDTVLRARKNITQIIQGNDHRLIVIVGPCSIHDPIAAFEYAHLLHQAAHQFADDLLIVMRTYFEKPRTTMGWKGFISDPLLDNSFNINYGLKSARKLLINLAQLGLPAGTEFLDLMVPHYISDLISWSVIGARTSESQVHRELASGLKIPVGFKNSTDGNIKIAVDAVTVAQHPHHLITINQDGSPVIHQTTGNNMCHIILRGSHTKANYFAADIQHAITLLHQAQLAPHLIIDCSHGNSQKEYQRQALVIDSITQQIHEGARAIGGVMLESYLVEGKQPLSTKQNLVYGQSITDGCLSWQQTLPLLEKLAKAAKTRRN